MKIYFLAQQKQLQSALAVSTLLGLGWIVGVFLILNTAHTHRGQFCHGMPVHTWLWRSRVASMIDGYDERRTVPLHTHMGWPERNG